MILQIIQQIIQMFDKIQIILMMKPSISNNRILRLNKLHCKPKSQKNKFSNIALPVIFLRIIHTGVLSIEEESKLFTKKIRDVSKGEKLIKERIS